MNDNLVDKAISQALKGDWVNAIAINKEILNEAPDDIEALNRLSRAFFETGDIKKATKTASDVLKIDPTNSIALKALAKYKVTKKTNIKKITSRGELNTADFIEEIGTTKHAELLNICSKDLLSTISPGDELILLSHSHKVSVTTLNNKYVGRIPDDLSAKLRSLTKKGYKFKVVVKSVEGKCIKVLIKEVKRGKGYEAVKSFTNESSEV